MPKLTLNQRYTRREISEMLGGSIQSFLPTKEGKVVCGCFRKEEWFNPGAPEEVLFGREYPMPNLEKSVEMAARQTEPIPVFLFRASGEWEYIGRYRCVKIERNPTVLKQKMAAYPKRGTITGVLYFEKDVTSR